MVDKTASNCCTNTFFSRWPCHHGASKVHSPHLKFVAIVHILAILVTSALSVQKGENTDSTTPLSV